MSNNNNNIQELINKIERLTKRKIKLLEDTDKDLEQTVTKILNRNLDPSWNETKFGYYVIDNSLNPDIFTLWRYRPSKFASVNPVTFMKRLPNNLLDAVVEAKKYTRSVPVKIDKTGELARKIGKKQMIWFGKYKNTLLGEIYMIDPSYFSEIYTTLNLKDNELDLATYYADMYFEEFKTNKKF